MPYPERNPTNSAVEMPFELIYTKVSRPHHNKAGRGGPWGGNGQPPAST